MFLFMKKFTQMQKQVFNDFRFPVSGGIIHCPLTCPSMFSNPSSELQKKLGTVPSEYGKPECTTFKISQK